MIATVLTILGMIGKVLLVLLMILVILTAAILFFPVSYRAVLKKNEKDFCLHASASWLFRFVHATVDVEKNTGSDSFAKNLRVAGISLLKIREKQKAKQAAAGRKTASGRELRREAPKKPTVQPGQRGTRPEHIAPLSIEVIRAKHPGVLTRLGAHISAKVGRIRNLFQKLRRGAETASVWMEYLGSASFARAKEVLLHEGAAILRHIFPKKVAGYVRFGTDDPARTGMILGVVSVLYPELPEKLTIEPDFLESGFEADLTVSGHLFLIVLLVRAVRIILHRDVRLLIRKITKKTGRGPDAHKPIVFREGRGNHGRKQRKQYISGQRRSTV